MDRKRRGNIDDWFGNGDWNIEDLFNNLDSEFQKVNNGQLKNK